MMTLDEIIAIARNTNASVQEKRIVEAFISGLLTAKDQETLMAMEGTPGLAEWAGTLIAQALAYLRSIALLGTEAPVNRMDGQKLK